MGATVEGRSGGGRGSRFEGAECLFAFCGNLNGAANKWPLLLTGRSGSRPLAVKNPTGACRCCAILGQLVATCKSSSGILSPRTVCPQQFDIRLLRPQQVAGPASDSWRPPVRRRRRCRCLALGSELISAATWLGRLPGATCRAAAARAACGPSCDTQRGTSSQQVVAGATISGRKRRPRRESQAAIDHVCHA